MLDDDTTQLLVKLSTIAFKMTKNETSDNIQLWNACFCWNETM